VLTVDFDQFPIEAGARVLDLGCGFGRHAFELYRRGAHVIAYDHSEDELREVAKMFYAMSVGGEAPPDASAKVVRGDVLSLPFPNASFDAVIASEVLEHIPDDERAMAEIARVVKPGGQVAVTVPRWWPEQINWALPREYQHTPGGHIRIYRGDVLVSRLEGTGLQVRGRHHAHALHSPYWWLNCTFGRETAVAHLQQAAGLGHHLGALDHPHHREAAQPGDGQEPGGVRRQAVVPERTPQCRSLTAPPI
jgi:SAM-dependent methyltransferase